MKAKIIKNSVLNETPTYERCSIAENYSTDDILIAHARIKPGDTTVPHHLKDVQETCLTTAEKV